MTTTTEPRTYTEQQAAEKLGVHRATLAYWRTHDKLPEGMVLPTPKAPITPGGRARPAIPYDVALVDKVAAEGWEAVMEPSDG